MLRHYVALIPLQFMLAVGLLFVPVDIKYRYAFWVVPLTWDTKDIRIFPDEFPLMIQKHQINITMSSNRP